MTYSSSKFMPKCSIPTHVVPVERTDVPAIVEQLVPNFHQCNVYFSIASWDGSWNYTCFNTQTKQASRVTLFDVIH